MSCPFARICKFSGNCTSYDDCDTYRKFLPIAKSEPIDSIEVDLEDGKKLVAKSYFAPEYKEIYVYLKDENDYEQDLVCVGEAYRMEHLEIIPHHGKYKVYLWGNPEDDDWTKSFEINARKEEEDDDE